MVCQRAYRPRASRAGGIGESFPFSSGRGAAVLGCIIFFLKPRTEFIGDAEFLHGVTPKEAEIIDG